MFLRGGLFGGVIKQVNKSSGRTIVSLAKLRVKKIN